MFEPGVRKFEYMDDRVCVMPQASRDAAGTFRLLAVVDPSGSNSAGFTAGQKTSALLTNVDQQTKTDLDYVDNTLDQGT
jgi:hypothetical protein